MELGHRKEKLCCREPADMQNTNLLPFGGNWVFGSAESISQGQIRGTRGRTSVPKGMES